MTENQIGQVQLKIMQLLWKMKRATAHVDRRADAV